jgi:hypothetical protein
MVNYNSVACGVPTFLLLCILSLMMPNQNQNKKPRKGGSRRGRGAERGNPRRNVPKVLTGMAMSRALSSPPREQVVVCRKWRTDSVAAQAVADTFGTYDFRLVDTDAFNLGAHYEHYCISKIEAFFRPQYRANNIATLGKMPIIYVAADPTDTSSWTSLSEARGHDCVITMDDSEGFCIVLSPRVNTYIYAGSAVNSGIGNANQWINTADTGVRHYGIKWAILGAGGALTDLQEWNVSIRYTVHFRIGKSRAGSFQAQQLLPDWKTENSLNEQRQKSPSLADYEEVEAKEAG